MATFYEERIQPQLPKIKRLAKRHKTKQEIARRIGVDYKTLLKHTKEQPELREIFISVIIDNGDKVAASLVKSALGYEYEEKEKLYDEIGDLVQLKVKTKRQPPNVGAALRILKMIDDYHGVDEELKTAQIRNVKADAELKETALEELKGGKETAPIIALMQGLRTLGVGDTNGPNDADT